MTIAIVDRLTFESPRPGIAARLAGQFTSFGATRRDARAQRAELLALDEAALGDIGLSARARDALVAEF